MGNVFPIFYRVTTVVPSTSARQSPLESLLKTDPRAPPSPNELDSPNVELWSL